MRFEYDGNYFVSKCGLEFKFSMGINFDGTVVTIGK